MEQRSASGRPEADEILAWHGILDAVYARVPVLPAGYGMMAPSSDATRSLLERSQSCLRRRLAYLSDKGEFNVALMWDPKAAANEVASRSERASTQWTKRRGGRRLQEGVRSRSEYAHDPAEGHCVTDGCEFEAS
jgi:hypothetical protein